MFHTARSVWIPEIYIILYIPIGNLIIFHNTLVRNKKFTTFSLIYITVIPFPAMGIRYNKPQKKNHTIRVQTPVYVNVCSTAKMGTRFWTGIKIRGIRAKLPPPAIYFIFAARLFHIVIYIFDPIKPFSFYSKSLIEKKNMLEIN